MVEPQLIFAPDVVMINAPYLTWLSGEVKLKNKFWACIPRLHQGTKQSDAVYLSLQHLAI